MDDEVAGFDEGRGDEGEGGGEEVDEEEAGAGGVVVWVVWVCVVLGRGWWCWVVALVEVALCLGSGLVRRGWGGVFRVGCASQSLDGTPGAEKVDWDREVFDRWMAEENAEDVEDVVAVVGEGERVDDGVVVDREAHKAHYYNGDDRSR